MSPKDAINAMTGESIFSMRTLLTIFSIQIVLIGMVGGAMLKNSASMTNMARDISDLRKSFAASQELSKTQIQFQIDNINAELERRVPVIYGAQDRWTDRDMINLQLANEKALKAAGIDIDLPDPYEVKKK